jgi:hypothetical protein
VKIWYEKLKVKSIVTKIFSTQDFQRAALSFLRLFKIIQTPQT